MKFLTNHGQSFIERIGRTIVRLIEGASFQIPYNNQILSAEAVYQYYNKIIENILSNLIESDTLNLLWDKLACHYKQ